jgi:hypothetical protein
MKTNHDGLKYLFISAGCMCSASTLADPPSAKADPCSIVTAADVQTVLGVAFPSPSASDDGIFRHCDYVSADKRFTVYVTTQDATRESFDMLPKLGPRDTPIITTLDAPAHQQRNSNILMVWKHGTALNIAVHDQRGNTNEARQLELEENLARAAIPRL